MNPQQQPEQQNGPQQPYQPQSQPAQPAPFTAPQNTIPPQQIQPPTPQQYAPTPAANNKKMIIVMSAVVALLIVGAAVWWFFLRGGSSPLASVLGTADVVDRSGDTLDLGNLIDSQTTIKDQDIKAKLHQQVNLSDGNTYMVTAVQRNFTVPKGGVVKAGAGKELIEVSVVVGNRDKQNSMYVSSSMFKLKNSAGGLQSSEFIDEQDTPDALASGDVASGKQTKGALVFEVDAGEKNLSLVLENKYEGLGDSSKKATLHSEVALD